MSEEYNPQPQVTPPGVHLREERERRGLSLQQVASEMHMDISVARALEEDDYSPLGAPIFVKGHLRNYARLLGLDADALVRDYEQLSTPRTPELVGQRPPVAAMGDGAAAGSWLTGVGAVVLLVLVLLLGWWLYQNPPERPGGEDQSGSVAALPADNAVTGPELQSTEPAGQAGAADLADPFAGLEAGAAATDKRAGEQGDLQDDLQGGLPESDRPAADTAAQPPASAAAQRGTTAANTPDNADGTRTASQDAPVTAEPAPATPPMLRVRLDFNADSWVEVYDAAGEPLLYELGQAGSSKTLRGQPPLRVFLGNAPGVEVRVNGRPYDHQAQRRSDDTVRFTLRASGE